MPYKVYKTIDDRRNHTCGFVIPNGGWYHVVEMTFENHKQLTDIGKRLGYSVDLVEGSVGMFDPDGDQVNPDTVVVDSVLKIVTAYDKIVTKRGGKTSPVKANHQDAERDDLIAKCEARGIRIDKRWSTQKLKELLSRANQPVAATLALG